jgi:hypothetical protein
VSYITYIEGVKSSTCYLCGKEGADSSDHIPPKNIFLFKTTDLITAPAHKSCNKKWELDDEYFRFAVVNMAFSYSLSAKEIFNKKIMKRLHAPEKWKFKMAMLKELGVIDAYSPDGIYLGKEHIMKIDANRVKGVIGRIARGLYFNRHHEPLPENWPLKSDLMQRNLIDLRKNFENKIGFRSVNNGVFKYLYKNTVEDKREGWFWFAFFDCVDFMVFTSTKEPPHDNFKSVPGIYV